MINRIVIIGGSGFLGSYLFSHLSKKYDVIGTYFSHYYDDLVILDLRDKIQVKSFFSKYDPSLVILCGGITRPDECEKDKKLSFNVNVKGVQNLVEYCDSKIIYFSTDYVFDGKNGPYLEEDIPNPINYYGLTKLNAEEIILKHREDNVIIRVPGLYGYNNRNNDFLKSINDLVIYKAKDIIGSTLLIDDVANHIPFFIKGKGIYHLSSGNSISRYEFTKMAVEILGLSTKVIGKKSSEIYTIAARPKNCSLLSFRHKLKIRDELSSLKYIKELINKEGFENQ